MLITNTASVNEHFLTYIQAESLTAEGLTTCILDCLKKNNLDPKNIVSQGYNGASVMRGSCTGVQARIKQVAPHAMYVHCNAHCLHCLNLCVVDSNQYIFLSTSKCHSLFIQLQKLSDTRWACRQSAVNALCYTYDAVLTTLFEVINRKDGAKATEARGLLAQVKSFEFIVSLVVFDKALSDVIQSTQLDLDKAAEMNIDQIVSGRKSSKTLKL